MCRENFQTNGVTFPENALIRGIFTHAPTHSKLASKFLSSRPMQKENLFPRTAEKGGEKYDLPYHSSVRKYENDLKH